MKLPNMPKLSSQNEISEEEKQKYIVSFILEYTGPFYNFMKYTDKGLKENFRVLHEQPYKNSVAFEDVIGFVDEFITNSYSWPIELYRGVNVSPAMLREISSSPVITMGGLSSWTRSLSVAQMYSKGAETAIVYVLKENKSAASISHLSMFYREQEFLAPTTAKYKVINKETKEGILYIYLEEEYHNE